MNEDKLPSEIALRDGFFTLSLKTKVKKNSIWISFKSFKNSLGKPNNFCTGVMFTFYSNFLKIVLNGDDSRSGAGKDNSLHNNKTRFL